MSDPSSMTQDSGTLSPKLPSLKVVVMDGAAEGVEVPLVKPVTTLGQDPGCDVVLQDRTVSRRHAALEVRDGRLWVKDLGSRNGTFVGQLRVTEAELPIGTVIKLGDAALAIHLRWQVREVSPSTAQRFGDLVGRSLAMREVFAIFERVAPTELAVLIEGESGTGKELAARSLHRASRRAAAAYVPFDCASVPRELAESELFGHKRGAFTGATADRQGAFEKADGGTLFLDELGELPLDVQAKLLRVLETGEVRHVGADETRKVEVRVIAATNRDLHAEVQRGRFRADLLYRLEVVKVRMPPLRQRPEDVAGIVELLLASQLAPGQRIEGENLRRLTSYGWPGNVRELRNVLLRATALAKTTDGGLRFDALVFNLGPASAGPATIGIEYPGVVIPLPYKEAKEQLLESFERAYVLALLDRNRDNVSKAATEAGLSRKHLYTLMKSLGLGDDPPAGT